MKSQPASPLHLKSHVGIIKTVVHIGMAQLTLRKLTYEVRLSNCIPGCMGILWGNYKQWTRDQGPENPRTRDSRGPETEGHYHGITYANGMKWTAKVVEAIISLVHSKESVSQAQFMGPRSRVHCL